MKIAFAASILGCVASPTFGQTATALGGTASQANPQAPDSGDVVVTAEKRPMTYLDTDVSVTVLNREQLNEARIRNLRDVDKLVPNVRFNTQGQMSDLYLSIRGVESNPFVVNRAAVYIDGIPFRELSNAVLNQVDSVEVLRGPQSTLYGANSESGLMLVTTRSPSTHFSGDIRATGTAFGNGVGGALDGYISGPLAGERLTGSVAFKLSSEDSYIRNLTPFDGRKAVINQVYAQGRLRWTPTDRLTVNVLGYLLNTDAPGLFEYEYLPIDIDVYNRNYAQFANRGLNISKFTYANDAPKDTRKRERVSGLSATWDVGYGHIDVAGSYRSEVSVGRGYDLDDTALTALAGAVYLDEKVTNGEVRYTSPDAKPFQFIIGASIYDERKANTLGTLIGPGGLDSYNKAPLQRSSGRDYGLFASASYALPFVPGLTASIGLRYDNAHRASTQTAGPLDLGPVGVVYYVDANLSRTFDATLPRVGLNYKASDNLSFFANAAKGYIPGGFNLSAIQAGIDLDKVLKYDNESLWSKEIGFKWKLPDGKGYVSGALFHILSNHWQEVQIAVDAQGRPLTSDYISANAAIRSQGFELEATYRPVKGLSLIGNFGYSDAVYRRLVVLSGLDLRGNKSKLVPEYTGYAAVRYQHPSGVFARADASFTGRIALDERNRAFQPANAVLGAQIGWENDRFGARVFIENLTNQRRFTSFVLNNIAFGEDGTLYGAIDKPRIFGVEFNGHF